MSLLKKRVVMVAVALSLTLSMSYPCYVAEYNFSDQKKFVDSNNWTYIGSATKDSTTSYGELKITQMYNTDDTINYAFSQVYAKATSSGTSILVTKGSWQTVPIPSSYQSAGKSVALYCMGHNPSLDCKISGFWNVH